MTTWIAQPCGCKHIPALGAKRERVCEHGYLFQSEKAARNGNGRNGTGLKRGRGFAVTEAQREKTLGLPCVGCGEADTFEVEAAHTDPAHLWPRSFGGCDHVDCVIPLCRKCHRRLDDPSDAFDLLPALVERGYWKELAHPILCHEVSLVPLLERVTGQKWCPLKVVADAV
jgi:hypothetical protein